MSTARDQGTLERAVQAAIAVTIVLTVLAAGSLESWIPLAKKLRWAALLVLAVTAFAWAWKRRGIVARPAVVGAVAFLSLAFLSAAWSVDAVQSLARGAALAVVLGAAAALSWAASTRLEGVERVLEAVVAAAGLVALGGLLVLIFRHERALQPATVTMPARFQGLGGGPNTATMVLAVAFPPAAHFALSSGPFLRRALAAFVATGLLASIVASGSRGALAAAFAGTLAWAVLRATNVRRAATAAAGVALLFGVCVAATTIAERAGSTDRGALPSGADPAPAPVRAIPPYADANLVLRLQDDVGRPKEGEALEHDRGRTLTGSSGRIEAWMGALRQARERPVLGYGFGTEGDAFVDRYVGFNSSVPENSYVGMALQLGSVGIVAFVALVVALCAPLRSALRGAGKGVAAACAGVVAAGLVLGLFQSYLYAAGNNATVAVWICAFLVAASAVSGPDARGA